MSTVGHIVRKDFARLRWTLLLWVVLQTAFMALATISSSLDLQGYFPFLIVASVFGTVFLPVMAIGLVMGVLHDDPACDTDAFWITRPISGAQLLAAKLITLFATSVVPVIALVPWWMAHGFSSGLLARAAGAAWIAQAWLVLLPLPCAILASTTSRFVSNLLCAAVAATLAIGLAKWSGIDANAVISSPAFAVGWIAVCALVGLNQFLTRATRRSVMLLIAGVVTGLALSLAAGPRAPSTPMLSAANQADTAPRVVAEAPPVVAASSSRAGRQMTIAEVILTNPAGVEITTNESEPDFRPLRFGEPINPGPQPETTYFVVNRRDGHAVIARSDLVGEILWAGGLRFSRSHLLISRRPTWPTAPDFDFDAWMKEAVLIKVQARSKLTAPPAAVFNPARN